MAGDPGRHRQQGGRQKRRGRGLATCHLTRCPCRCLGRPQALTQQLHMRPDGINGKNISSLNLADRVSQDKVHSFFVFLRANIFKCGASCVLKNLFQRLLPLAEYAWPTLPASRHSSFRLSSLMRSAHPAASLHSQLLMLLGSGAGKASLSLFGGARGVRAVHTEGARRCLLGETNGHWDERNWATLLSLGSGVLCGWLLGPAVCPLPGDPSLRPPGSAPWSLSLPGSLCPEPHQGRLSGEQVV